VLRRAVPPPPTSAGDALALDAVGAGVMQLAVARLQPPHTTAAGKLLDLLGVAAHSRAFAHVGAAHRLTIGATLPAPAPIFPRYVEAEEGVPTPAKP
jgi:methionyl-tRNA synthetase